MVPSWSWRRILYLYCALRGEFDFLRATVYIFGRWGRVQVLLLVGWAVHDLFKVFFNLSIRLLQSFTISWNRIRLLILDHKLWAIIDWVLELRDALLHIEAVDVWHKGMLLILVLLDLIKVLELDVISIDDLSDIFWRNGALVRVLWTFDIHV